MGIELAMTGGIHNVARLERFDQPVARSLPLYFNSRWPPELIAEFGDGECLGFTPAQRLLRRIGIAQSTDTCTRHSSVPVRQKRAGAGRNAGGKRLIDRIAVAERDAGQRKSRERSTGDESQTMRASFA